MTTTNDTNTGLLHGRALALTYFSPKGTGSNVWVCKCGCERSKGGTGYTNLVSHMIFDGWSSGSTHYVAVFPSYPDNTTASRYQRSLLAFAPMNDEESLSAAEHLAFLEFVLEVFGKDMQNVCALLGIIALQT